MKKTIWYINKYFAPKTHSTPGGRDWNLLKEVHNLGYRVVVLASDSNSVWETELLDKSVVREEREGLDIVWLRTMKYGVAKSFKRILSWFHFEWNIFFLNKKNLPAPDVVVVSSLSLLTVLNGIYLKRRYGCKFVFEVRDIWPLTIIEENGFSKYNPFVFILSFIEKIGYEKADSIIGTMPNLKEHVESVSSTKTPVYCIPMGIPENSLVERQEDDDIFPGELFPENKLKIIYSGTIGITNALDVFFRAAEMLVDNDDILFFVLGDGPLKNEFQKKYSRLKNVIFLPRVSRCQVQSVLMRCDIVYFSTFPSKVWNYGQSLNKLIDYMLAGKPVLASYSGYPSMINEAEGGFFVPAGDGIALADKILELSKREREDLRKIGENGKKWLIDNRRYSKLARDFVAIMTI
ncbi:glycosyltransferase family 4 protein [Acidovorax sp. HDW3]|uniref:glycosyltransferase family 4 protein n=1 Tax=Acidovorax sp. HDW3 TaxID=2714923 RepID=UPI00140876DE|nr:glycosyltransferase family 4 protein [Acidovorax sp. HDW3]QIL42834.1 glycosyltransferase family 4 protein [Acidovorax sp. HDW3]